MQANVYTEYKKIINVIKLNAIRLLSVTLQLKYISSNWCINCRPEYL